MGENLIPVPIRSREIRGCSVVLLLLNTVLKFLASSIRQVKELKEMQVGKEEV
jgi:hypothetical protein